jgi:hypothetical protein
MWLTVHPRLSQVWILDCNGVTANVLTLQTLGLGRRGVLHAVDGSRSVGRATPGAAI